MKWPARLDKYCKESSGNLDYFKKLLISAKEVGLNVFMGDEVGIKEGLLAGACGIVPVCANYEPSTCVKLMRPRSEGISAR